MVPDAPGDEARRALLRRWNYWLVFEVRDADDMIVVLSLGSRHDQGCAPQGTRPFVRSAAGYRPGGTRFDQYLGRRRP